MDSNQAFAGSVDYWWIVGAFFLAVALYTGYQNYGGHPFTKFRVTNKQDGKGLLFRFDRSDVLEGKPIGNAWQFKASGTGYHAIYGPYIQHPIRKGKYRAIYRMKADNIEGDNTYIAYIDIASSYKGKRGGKTLAARSLTANDFHQSDQYRNFHLDFDVISDENELEFRIAPTSGYTLTLDSIQLTRKLI